MEVALEHVGGTQLGLSQSRGSITRSDDIRGSSISALSLTRDDAQSLVFLNPVGKIWCDLVEQHSTKVNNIVDILSPYTKRESMIVSNVFISGSMPVYLLIRDKIYPTRS